MKILILSIKAGAGHLRAAQALEEAFRTRLPGAEIRHVDALEHTNAAFRKGFTEGYETLAKELPSVWGYLYGSLEEKPAENRMKKAAALFDRLNARPLRKLVKKFAPDRVVCTHYMPAEVLAPLRRAKKLAAPLSIVLTDYDIHTMWIQRGADSYFVATREMAYALREKGIGGATVEAAGIPILSVFRQPFPSKPTLRQRLGLAPDAPTVLLSAGGFGLIRVDRIVSVLAERLPRAQFLAVAGKNEKLLRDLRRAAEAHGERVRAFGFVDNMHELMAASDLAVAKSGGLTTSECFALGLPMVVIKPIPGQEERNAIHILERGAGVWAQSAANIIFKSEELLNDPKRLAAMQAAARAAAKPEAADRIVDAVMRER